MIHYGLNSSAMKLFLAFIFCLLFCPTFLEASPALYKRDLTDLRDRMVDEDDAFEMNILIFYDDNFKEKFGPGENEIRAKIEEIMILVKNFFMALHPKVCINIVGIIHINGKFSSVYPHPSGYQSWR